MEDKGRIEKGTFKIFTSPTGMNDWTLRAEVKNLIVNLGLNLIRDNAFKAQTYFVDWGAVSDNTDVPAAGDTSLTGNELRKAIQTKNFETQSVFFGEYFISSTEWIPASITNVTKAGMYYQATGNFLVNLAKFDAIAVDETVDMLVQWTVTHSN